MKECELCGVRAQMYCEADHASLCWDCDEKVHGANFLVMKHQRSLLCHVCQLPTPWTGVGPKLTPTVSVCESCVQSRHGSTKIDLNREPESEEENDSDEEEEEDYDNDDEEDDENEEENQVVPWSCCSYSPAQTPPAASSSDSEAETSESKRVRENVDVSNSEDEVGFDGTASFSGSLRVLKRPRLVELEELNLLERLEKDMINCGNHPSAAAVLRICKLSTPERSR